MSRKYKKRKYKEIDLDTAVNRYVNRNKAKMITIFGSEHIAKSVLKSQPYFDSNYKDPKKATKDIKQFMKFVTEDTDKSGNKLGTYSYKSDLAELYKAKKEAVEVSGTITMQELNKKISTNYTTYNKYLGSSTINNQHFDRSVIGYYDVMNEDYVLAEIEYEITPKTKVRRYEFLDKAEL